jgi:flagellar biosynthesis/type III secretory pathway chaperone
MTTATATNLGDLIAKLTGLMGQIVALIEQETKLVRAGKLTEASKLEPQKTELSGQYLAIAGQIRAAQPQLAKTMPEDLQALRHRHEEFHAILQMNLTVLATAHAVSESIMRGVSTELARKASPQTYGASGQHSAPNPKAAQPLTISRVL